MTIREQLDKLYEDEPHHKLRLKFSLSCKLINKTKAEEDRHNELLKIKEENTLIMRGKRLKAKVEYVPKKKKSKYGF